MQKDFHVIVFVQQSLIQMVIFMLHAYAVPLFKCILQPWLCHRGKVLLPLKLTLAVISVGGSCTKMSLVMEPETDCFWLLVDICT